jgi:hypothetical protein
MGLGMIALSASGAAIGHHSRPDVSILALNPLSLLLCCAMNESTSPCASNILERIATVILCLMATEYFIFIGQPLGPANPGLRSEERRLFDRRLRQFILTRVF